MSVTRCLLSMHGGGTPKERHGPGLLRRALALCRGFPDSDRRLEQELDLLVKLGPALVTTEGYSAAEVGETYERALELFPTLRRS